MAFPELAYPEPGWISRFVGRQEQFRIVQKILDSTRRGVVLPVVQVIGGEGVGKSWFLQRLRWNWRDIVDVPVVPLRLTIPAMTQKDKAIDALVTRLVNRWKLNLRLTEFALGRIAHLRGESIERFGIYQAAVKYLPDLERSKGESELRRVLVERGVDKLRTLWGQNWSQKFSAMSPAELEWYLPELLGMDIDQTLRNSRLRAFILLVDDADFIPEFYHSLLRMKKHSSLTLIVMSSRKPMPTQGLPVETIPIEPLPLLERRAYLYSLGVDEHNKQDKISRKYGDSSLGFTLGALEQKQLIERNEGIQNLLATLLICHRSSLDVLLQITKDTGSIAAFFAEPTLVDMLEQPDRLPWRFMLHSAARKWLSQKITNRPKPETLYGDVIGRLTLFANRDFNRGMPVLYWFFRDALAKGEMDNVTDALMAADEIASNMALHSIRLYNRFLHLSAFCPRFGREYIINYARLLVLHHCRDEEDDYFWVRLLVAAGCLLDAGRDRLALRIARSILPKISAKVMSERGKNAANMLLRAETNRIIGLAMAECGQYDEAETALARARESANSAKNSSKAMSGEANLMLINVRYATGKVCIAQGNQMRAWSEAKLAMESVVAIMGGIAYRANPTLDRAEAILAFIFKHHLWNHDKEKTLHWLKRIIILCERNIKSKGDENAKLKLPQMLMWAARIVIEFGDTKQAMEWLNQAELLLQSLGERHLWLSNYFRMLSIELSILKAETFALMGNAPNSYDLALQAYNVVQRWNLESYAQNMPTIAKIRIIGGLALARMEQLEEANVWLSAGTSYAEKSMRDNPSDPSQYELQALCGDAYQEMARIAMHKKDTTRAAQMAKIGIEHKLMLMNIVESPTINFEIGELYMLLLEAISPKKPAEIVNAMERAVPILMAACTNRDKDRDRCVTMAEQFFRFAVNIAEKINGDYALKIKIIALSFFPVLKKDELINQAREICHELSEKKIPADFVDRFKRAKELIGKIDKSDGKGSL